MESTKKKIVIQQSATVKVNTGNYENIEVTESIEAEVEYENTDELKKKGAGMASALAMLLKSSTEKMLQETNRKRVVCGKETELW